MAVKINIGASIVPHIEIIWQHSCTKFICALICYLGVLNFESIVLSTRFILLYACRGEKSALSKIWKGSVYNHIKVLTGRFSVAPTITPIKCELGAHLTISIFDKACILLAWLRAEGSSLWHVLIATLLAERFYYQIYRHQSLRFFWIKSGWHFFLIISKVLSGGSNIVPIWCIFEREWFLITICCTPRFYQCLKIYLLHGLSSSYIRFDEQIQVFVSSWLTITIVSVLKGSLDNLVCRQILWVVILYKLRLAYLTCCNSYGFQIAEDGLTVDQFVCYVKAICSWLSQVYLKSGA